MPFSDAVLEATANPKPVTIQNPLATLAERPLHPRSTKRSAPCSAAA